jgi:hypothetical protein
LERLALVLVLALGAEPTCFFLTVFLATVTGPFFGVDVLFCAQTSVGNTDVNTKTNPKKAAAKLLDAEPLTGGNKEKLVRIGVICN